MNIADENKTEPIKSAFKLSRRLVRSYWNYVYGSLTYSFEVITRGATAVVLRVRVDVDIVRVDETTCRLLLFLLVKRPGSFVSSGCD